ncbi:MAG: UDP-N-acetylmuramoyl-L-alanine--D-glutamate ligase [Candidatus Glassbacteria bacterium]
MNRLPVKLHPYSSPGPLVKAPAAAAVIGAGRSGIAAARLLLKRGYRVRITDSSRDEKLAEACRPLIALGAQADLGEHRPDFLAGSDFLVISPGIDERQELFRHEAIRDIPVFSEVEVAYWYCPVPLVAVTGTNGKSTTASLLGDIFNEGGVRARVAGNIGLALCSAVDELEDEQVIVAEISSYQLHTTESFHPRVGALLNLSPDHLDRYDTVNQYYDTKFRLFRRMDEGDLAVLNARDPEVTGRAAGRLACGVAWFGLDESGRAIAFSAGDSVRVRAAGGGWMEVMKITDIALKGRHNLENVLAAACAAYACGVSPQAIGRATAAFRGLPHRLEPVASHRGVTYYNDSKATTVESVKRALECFDCPLWLIMGGRPKGDPFIVLDELVRERVERIFAIGEAAGRIERELGKYTQVETVTCLEEAVAGAVRAAREGGAVLLSPGCASFDQFRDFEQRGEMFKKYVRKRIDDDAQ